MSVFDENITSALPPLWKRMGGKGFPLYPNEHPLANIDIYNSTWSWRHVYPPIEWPNIFSVKTYPIKEMFFDANRRDDMSWRSYSEAAIYDKGKTTREFIEFTLLKCILDSDEIPWNDVEGIAIDDCKDMTREIIRKQIWKTIREKNLVIMDPYAIDSLSINIDFVGYSQDIPIEYRVDGLKHTVIISIIISIKDKTRGRVVGDYNASFNIFPLKHINEPFEYTTALLNHKMTLDISNHINQQILNTMKEKGMIPGVPVIENPEKVFVVKPDTI